MLCHFERFVASATLGLLVALGGLVASNHGAAAQADTNAPAPGSQSAWTSQCTSANRQAHQDCSITQRLFLTKTGQLIGAVTVRLPADSGSPVIMIQTPLDLFLPAGVTLSVDGGDAVPFTLQTCDVKGCYAGSKMPDSLLFGFLKGQTLKIAFQDLRKQTITLPMPLAGFSTAYQSIK